MAHAQIGRDVTARLGSVPTTIARWFRTRCHHVYAEGWAANHETIQQLWRHGAPGIEAPPVRLLQQLDRTTERDRGGTPIGWVDFLVEVMMPGQPIEMVSIGRVGHKAVLPRTPDR